MQTDICGQTALITGGARRLGRAIAVALARRGADCVVHYHRSNDEALALVEELQSLGVGAWAIGTDLTDADDASRLVDRSCELAGTSLDILINNASVFTESRLDSFTIEDLAANINVNALAPAFTARAFAAQGSQGAIVNLLDCRIVDRDETHVSYHLSKRMLAALTNMMALEYAPRVRVNAVAPGLILPPSGKDESYLAGLAHTNPLHAVGTSEDIAEAAVFLVQSSFVTGQVLYVDGGRHLRGRMYE